LTLLIAGLLEFARVIEHIHACIFNLPVVRLEAGLGLLHLASAHLLQLADHLVLLVKVIYKQYIMSIKPIRISQSPIILSSITLNKSG